MNNIVCPSCGKSNSNKADICQYCGTALKHSATEPLAPIHTGDMPVKRKTSDLENTLPGWLRSARKASSTESETMGDPSTETPEDIQPAKPAAGKKPSAQPVDLLAGLSQINDEEEEAPDWLKSMQSSLPSIPTPALSQEEVPQESDDESEAASPFTVDDSDESYEPPAEETPDWLTSLKGLEQSSTTTVVSQPPASQSAAPVDMPPMGDLPDWLSALTGGGSLPSTPAPSALPPAASEPASDWLSGLGGDFISDESSTSIEHNAPDSAPDWLSRMDEQTSDIPMQTEPVMPEESDTPISDLPGWLDGIAGAVAAPAAVPTPADDMPDWMKELQASTPVTAEPIAQVETPVAVPASADDMPDWMKELQASTPVTSEPAAQVETPEAVPTPADDMPDWMKELQASTPITAEPAAQVETPAAVPTSADDMPDWMKELQASTPVTAEPIAQVETPAAVSTPADDMPDWMKELQASTPITAEPAAQVEAPAAVSAPVDDMPDWMKELQASTPVTAEPVAQVEIPAAIPATADDVPDWMKELQASTPAADEPAAQVETPAKETPDWINSLPAVPDAPVTGDLPSWLNETTAEKASEPDATISKPFETGTLGGNLSDGALNEIPDWMASLGSPVNTPKKDNPITPEAEEVDLLGVGLPDWLGGLPVGDGSLESLPELPKQPSQGEPVQAMEPPLVDKAKPVIEESATAAPAGEESIDSIFAMDMPEWLSGFAVADPNQSTLPGVDASQQDASLSPAELPSWVQAMRPMESVMADASENQDDQEVENKGPLIGLRSVLPVQAGMVDEHKSKPYVLKLQASETQQAQAALLDSLLASESTAQKISGRTKKTGSRPLRWLITVLLLLVIILSLTLALQIFPSPQLAPAPNPVISFISVIDGLSSSAPVLVVVDYQPGYAGELETAAGPLITQLSEKNIPLAFLSTSPMGLYLADRLQRQYASGYQLNIQYVNLGYLPGDAVGIKAFAAQPASAIGQDNLLGNIWAAPALAGATVNSVTSLDHFGAVIVVSDNPDTARLWIEQAHSTSPLLMVVSAQAEQMIRPYLESGQVAGVLAGLEGATIYASQPGMPSVSGPRNIWDAFGMAVLVAESSIVVGGIWSLISGLRTRRAAVEQDEA